MQRDVQVSGDTNRRDTITQFEPASAVVDREEHDGGSEIDTSSLVTESGEDMVARGKSNVRKKRERGISFWLELPLLFIIALAVAVLIKAFAFQVFRIPSASMFPTLQIGDRVVVNKLTYSPEGLSRGDIIVFVDPAQRGHTDERGFFEKVRDGIVESLGGEGRNRHLIKRIIGCPGQTIQIRGGQLLVDGVRTPEPYLPRGVHTQGDLEVRLGDGEFFVMGDNRQNSSDSRVYGPVRSEEIVGRAAVRIWPAGRVGGMPGGVGTCAPGAQ